MKRESRRPLEDGVCSRQRCADVKCGGGDPEVVGVDGLVEGVSGNPTGMTEFGNSGEQGVADRHDGRRRDRLLQPTTPLVAPARDEGAVAELGDGNRSEEDLMSRHDPDFGVEADAAARAHRRAEETSVDDDPHDSSAAVNASSSSSDRSSITRASIEASTGAAAS